MMGQNLWIAAAALLALPVGYGVAGTIGGMIPANRAARPPAAGITIYVESNGIHTGIVLPKIAAGIDLGRLAPARDLADPRYGGHRFVAVGWGERDFYIDTPTWADVRPATVAHALIGSDAVLLHVEHIARPLAGEQVRALIVTPRQYRRLVAYIHASLAPNRKRYRGYGRSDVFYTARGHYSGIATCNAWTGAALRYAGIRVGTWTPFPAGVMRWF